LTQLVPLASHDNRHYREHQERQGSGGVGVGGVEGLNFLASSGCWYGEPTFTGETPVVRFGDEYAHRCPDVYPAAFVLVPDWAQADLKGPDGHYDMEKVWTWVCSGTDTSPSASVPYGGAFADVILEPITDRAGSFSAELTVDKVALVDRVGLIRISNHLRADDPADSLSVPTPYRLVIPSYTWATECNESAFWVGEDPEGFNSFRCSNVRAHLTEIVIPGVVWRVSPSEGI
jgi:hypothetical protein